MNFVQIVNMKLKNKIKMNSVKEKVILWAKERNITNPDNAHKQLLKLVEEVGELTAAVLKDKLEEKQDAIGDIQVVLIILCEQLGIDMDQALSSAYEVIKNRTGKTVNGVFIKSEDNDSKN